MCVLLILVILLAAAVEKKTGQKVFLTTMEQVNNTLPSKEAQYSNLGLKLGRQKMTKDRQRRKSTMIKSNQVKQLLDFDLVKKIFPGSISDLEKYV